MNAIAYKPLTTTHIEASLFGQIRRGEYAIDFGKVWFGTLRICIDSPVEDTTVQIRLGEVLGPDGRIDQNPPGTVRVRELKMPVKRGRHFYVLHIPSNPENTGRRTIKMPEAIGEVLPFRYAEIDSVPGLLTADDVRLIACHYPFVADASAFESSDDDLNRIWALSKHTMFATSFCGMFVDS